MSLIHNQEDELLDLVDENDQVVGKEWRSVIRATKQLHRIRAVWFFLINKEGKLWIPRRAATKKVHPLALDGSVVGAVSAGETYEQALEREALEEIGMNIAGKYTLVGYVNPSQGLTMSHVRVYQMFCDQTPIYSQDEFCEDAWLSPQEILSKYRQGETMKSTLPHLVEHFFIKTKL